MEIFMNDAVLVSKRINIVTDKRNAAIPGESGYIELKEGELLLIPAFFLDRKVGKVRDLKSYIVINDVVVINEVINFKGNIGVEISFYDATVSGTDINRFKVPFMDKIDCSIPGVRKIDISGKLVGYSLDVLYSNSDKRLENLNGFAIAKASFTVDINARLYPVS